MAVFGAAIYERWFACCSTWVGHEPSSCPCWAAGPVLTSKHTWRKGWVNGALHNYSKTGFSEVSEAVWPGSEESGIKITAPFQISGKNTTFDRPPNATGSAGLGRQVDLLGRLVCSPELGVTIGAAAGSWLNQHPGTGTAPALGHCLAQSPG